MTTAWRKAGLSLSMALGVTFAAAPALADTVVVKMLNQGSDGGVMVFEPAVVEIEPGDTVHFKATDPGHNVQSLDDMTPQGATSYTGGFNEDQKVTFEEAGLHAYKCMPHFGMGMVGVVKVGDGGGNADEVRNKAQSLPGRASSRMTDYLAQLN